jgi:secondary thiamine-phosphate synthase enzyme
MIELSVKTSRREEFVDITSQVQSALQKNDCDKGICVVFVPHTTAGVTINENADPSVVRDMIYALNRLIPHNWDFHHMEGNSDAHIKASLVGSSINVIVENRSLRLGTWQGIYFCEFDGARSRKVWVTFIPSK